MFTTTTRVINRPKKGDSTKVEPIRSPKDVTLIRKFLAPDPNYLQAIGTPRFKNRRNLRNLLCLRNQAYFNLGVNTALRAIDISRLRIRDFEGVVVGEEVVIKEKKTGKYRMLTVNQLVYDSIQNFLVFRSEWGPTYSDDFLLQGFQHHKPSSEHLKTASVNNMLKDWTSNINLRGNYGSHSLRKTFGYHQHKYHGRSTASLMQIFNHRSEKETLEYLCIQKEDIKEIYQTVI